MQCSHSSTTFPECHFGPVMLQLLGDQARPLQTAAARKTGAGETIQVQVLASQSIHRVLVNSNSSQID